MMKLTLKHAVLEIHERALCSLIKLQKLTTFSDELDEDHNRAGTAKDTKLDQATCNACCKSRNNSLLIHCPVIQALAEKLYKEIGLIETGFTLSSGWS